MGMNPRARRRRSQAQRSWPGQRPSPANDPVPPRRRRQTAPDPGPTGPVVTIASILDDFNESWGRGEPARLEDYLDRLGRDDMAELIYHEYCLAEASNLDPDPAGYLRRFPGHSDPLGRLFALHSAVSVASLRSLVEPADLPQAGDSIGPYYLARELGRGAFARVFLANEADLGDRPVVLKVSTRPSSEPSLLARARHAHIVEVLRQAEADDGALHLVCMPFLGGATLAAVLESRRGLGRRPRTGRDLLDDLDRVSAPEYPDAELPRPAREILAGLSHAQGLAWIVARLAEALDHAHGRGVSHGDLKPSNILLTAEGTPMLFDFNLAVDWRAADAGGPAADAGGTMAYMAPRAAPGHRRRARRVRSLSRPSPGRPLRDRPGPARGPHRPGPRRPRGPGRRPPTDGLGPGRIPTIGPPRGPPGTPGPVDPPGPPVDPGEVPGPRPPRPLRPGQRAGRGPRQLEVRPPAPLRRRAPEVRGGPTAPAEPGPPRRPGDHPGHGDRRRPGRPRLDGRDQARPGDGQARQRPRPGSTPGPSASGGSADGDPNSARSTRPTSPDATSTATTSSPTPTGEPATTSGRCPTAIARSSRPGSSSSRTATPSRWASVPTRRPTGGGRWRCSTRRPRPPRCRRSAPSVAP